MRGCVERGERDGAVHREVQPHGGLRGGVYVCEGEKGCVYVCM